MAKRKSIGILGGGQLARMMCLQAHRLNLEVHVLSESKQDPAYFVTNFWHQGSIKNKKDVQKLSRLVDIITFESEFADTSALKSLKCRFYPSLKIISTLQDRLFQKKSLVKNKLSTSPFINTDCPDKIKNFYQQHQGFVAKKRMFGYDGYGTIIVKNKKQLQQFLSLDNKLNFIIEAFIPFEKELSLVCARSAKGKFTHYPLVESVQKDAKCFSVKGPVIHTKLSPLKNKIKSYLQSINYVGVIAFELFQFNNQLIINEVAPRVHNTGHHTLDSFNIDQFSLHLMCLLGEDLVKLQPLNKGYAMVNLIGSSTSLPQLSFGKYTKLHWYNKKDNRPGRKMGHINSVSENPEKALKWAINDLKRFKL